MKSPDCEICQERQANNTNSTLPTTNNPPPLVPGKNASNPIEKPLKKQIIHTHF